MKAFLLILTFLLGVSPAVAQHEYAPLVEKEFAYKDWTYKSIRENAPEINLRAALNGKKLVMVLYFAPWCPNWRLQAPVAERLYAKYKANGFEIIGVGEYDSVAAMRTSVDSFKITFPVVYESDKQSAKTTTPHYGYRQLTGDRRNWGSPWSVFLETSKVKPKGEVLTEKTFVVNGELIEAEAEAWIREKLGLPKDEKKANVSVNKEGEVCDPNVSLKKP